MKKFPSWRYAAAANPVLVQDPGESDALGPGWYESPADIPDPLTKPPPKEEDPKPVPKRRRRK